jgi:uncharacterized protein YmfQ (DUF2313 family)
MGAIIAKGGLSRVYFIAIAAALGYTITITEGSGYLFRIGITMLPSALFDASIQWVWYVNTSHGTTAQDTNLESIFYRLKPAHTKVEFIYS